jgi:hypothetical protein
MSDTMVEKVMRKFPHEINVLKRNSYELITNYILNRQYKRYTDMINKLHNKHKGDRCFIIGTGPSLNRTKFSLIKNEILFGVNTLFRGLEKYGIDCKYWCIGDEQLFDSIYKPLLNLDTILFLAGYAGRHYLKKKKYYEQYEQNKPILLKRIGDINENYIKNALKGLYSGGTVMIESLQIAHHMGFDEVYILGCDCDFSGQFHFDGKEHEHTSNKTQEEINSEKLWRRIFNAYRLCKKMFEEDGRTIYNATPGGKLEVFKRKGLEELS